MGKQNDGSLIFDTRIDSKDFEKDVKSLQKMSTTAFAAIGAAAVAGFGAAIKVGGDFEEAMSSVSAISMATAEEYEMLSNAAREMGETTKFSATQCANALEYLSLAGYSAKESVEALPYVLNLAAAGGMDLAYASDLLTDSMAVMGLGISDMGNFSDQLAMAASKANTSVQQLGEAVLVAGGQAKLAGMSTDQMNTALSILADKGIKGSEGGTALRNVLKNLYTPTSAAAKVMKSLGIETSDANGNLIKAQDVLKQLKSKLDALAPAKRIEAMGDIFDTRTIAAANALLDDCGDRWNELTDYLNNCDGAASDMAKTMNDNLKGDLTILGSAAEGLGITFYETFSGKARGAVQDATKAVGALTELIKSGKLAEPLKLAASGMVAFCAATATFKTIAIYSDLQKVISGIKGYTAATKLGTAVQQIMNSTLLANPYTLTLAALVALTAGIVVYAKTHKSASEQALESAKSERDAIKETQEAYENARNERAKDVAANVEQIDYVKQLSNELRNLADDTGAVEDKDRGRASFILTELNKALGTEYELTGNQIQRYSELCDSIDQVIEKKRLEALLSGINEDYAEAIKNQTQANLEMVDALSKVQEAQKKVNELEEKGYQDSSSNYELQQYYAAVKALETYTDKYEIAVDKVEGYNNAISSFEAAKTADIEENTAKAVEILEDYYTSFSDTYEKELDAVRGNKAEEERVTGEHYAKALQDLANYAEQYEAGARGYTEAGLNAAKENAEKMKVEAEKIGLNLQDGIIVGLNGFEKNVKPFIDRLAKSIPEWARKVLGIESPSKVMRDEVGMWIPLGVAKGIEKTSDSAVKAFQNMLEKLQYQRDLDIINDDEYYTQLEKLRDKYFKVGTSEWLKYTKEIYKYQKSAVEAEKREIEKLYDDISGYASKKIDEVLAKQDKFASKLKSYTHLFNSNTVSLGDTEFSYYSMHDLHKDTEAITSYVDGLDSLNARLKELGVSGDVVKEFMSELSDMSIEEGAGFTKTLLNANDSNLLNYINAYSDNRAAIKGLSSRYYQDDMDAAWDDSIKNMVEKLQEAGYEIPEGFFTSGTISAEKFGEAFTSEIDNQLSAVREKVEGFYAAISKMFGMSFELSAAGGGGNTYSSTYYIQPNDSSTSAQLAAIRAEERLNKLRGGYK